MPKLMNRFLLISILSLHVFSCKSYQIPDAELVSKQVESIENKYFSNLETDYIYKAQISVYDNNLSGIFIAKRINPTTHRVALTTDFGNTLFDFEIAENSFKVNYVIPDLNNPFIKSTLKKDFRLLLKNNFKIDNQLKTKDYDVYKSKKEFIFVNQNNSIQKITTSSGSKEKRTIVFDAKNTTFAENITITHYNIPLEIKLSQITNTN